MNRVYDVKAIPTEFNGIKYKSRLEARWAVFFDVLGVQALYEYEGYRLSSGWYLPDFYAPSMNAWFEVKPTELTEREKQLCHELNESTGKRVIQLSGDVGYRDINGIRGYNCDGDIDYLFCTCPICGQVGVEYKGRGERVCGNKCVPSQKEYWTGDDPKLIHAFDLASTFQFNYARKELPENVITEVDRRASREAHIALLNLQAQYLNDGDSK